MHATMPLLEKTDFPAIRRTKLETLQVNLGYLCNIACLHCHVNAGPSRKELMDSDNIDVLIDYMAGGQVKNIDLTGGSPEMNTHFRRLVEKARELDVHVMVRCNPTILNEPGYEWVPQFYADNQCEVIASLPCYTEDNVDKQRGNGVFNRSIEGLQQLNAIGYGKPETGLALNLVYNPTGPSLPPPQAALQADYEAHLSEHFGIVFNQLFTITNMPIKRFGSTLISRGQFSDYMDLLKNSYSRDNLSSVMCRSLISVDWQGYVYDCDFNQMLEMPLAATDQPKIHLRDLIGRDLEGEPIAIADHCYGCTAGQGSSCGGALD